MRANLGPYRLLGVLGRGGMGIVFRGVHERLDRQVAIKALAPELTRDPQFRERFFSEARTQAQLHHPNIVAIYDLLEDGGEYFIAMEMFEGRGLDQVLEQRQGQAMAEPEACALFSQVLAALDCAHSHGVIHRDVKPSNVLVGPRGEVKLMDFGIALLVGDKRLTQSSQTIGTPVYMSPEQILRPRSMDHRTDIYSAAVVLFEMLAGRPPFDAETEYEVKKQHIELPPAEVAGALSGVSRPVVEAIVKALAKEPEERFSSAAAFRRALGAAGTAAGPVAPLAAAPAVAHREASWEATPEPSAAGSGGPGPGPKRQELRRGARGRLGGERRPAVARLAVAAGSGLALLAAVVGLVTWLGSSQGGSSADREAPATVAQQPSAPVARLATPIVAEAPSSQPSRVPQIPPEAVGNRGGDGGPRAAEERRPEGEGKPGPSDAGDLGRSRAAAARAEAEIHRRTVEGMRSRLRAGIEEVRAHLTAHELDQAAGTARALLSSAAKYRGELVEEIATLNLLQDQVTEAIVASRTQEKRAAVERKAWEERVQEIQTLLDERSYPEAKKLAERLLASQEVPGDLAAQARQLSELAEQELKKIWADTKVGDSTNEIINNRKRKKDRDPARPPQEG
jgi:tRNA A-37 threonylcarbamoyl transferase component Bud32